jgi:hypothetical protein
VQPELVVLMTGALDVFAMRTFATAPSAYRGLVDEALGILTAGGAHVVVVGVLPQEVTGSTYQELVGDRANRPFVNQALAAAVGDRGGDATYLALDGLFVLPDGRFSLYVPGPEGGFVLARKPDGLHICPDGAALVGEAAVAGAARWFDLPAVDLAYRDGAWRQELRYDYPAGACDADPAVVSGAVPPPPPWSETAVRNAASSTTAG